MRQHRLQLVSGVMPDAAFYDENAISVLNGCFCVQLPQFSGRIAG